MYFSQFVFHILTTDKSTLISWDRHSKDKHFFIIKNFPDKNTFKKVFRISELSNSASLPLKLFNKG